jgi:hypothetical protein
MLRLVLAALLMLGAVPASASDWRYVADLTNNGPNFVDLDSISPRDGTIRSVVTFEVRREPDEEGIAAQAVHVRVNCPERKLSVFRFVNYDANDREVEDLRGTRPFIGPMPAGSIGGVLVDYVCSHGGSDAAAPRVGDRLPFEAGRRVLRETQP